jgi:predicted DNA-binding transcriptional regulator AlpA
MSPSLNDLPSEIAQKRILGTAQAAAFVGISVRAWERMRANGDAPPAVKISERKLGYTVESLTAWIASRTQVQSAA